MLFINWSLLTIKRSLIAKFLFKCASFRSPNLSKLPRFWHQFLQRQLHVLHHRLCATNPKVSFVRNAFAQNLYLIFNIFFAFCVAWECNYFFSSVRSCTRLELQQLRFKCNVWKVKKILTIFCIVLWKWKNTMCVKNERLKCSF